MGVESLQTVSVILFIAAGVLFIVSVVLFFVLDIPKAFGLVSGLTAARGIKRIQERSKSVSSGSGSSAGTSPVATNQLKPESAQTSKIKTGNLEPAQAAPAIAETTLLNTSHTADSPATTILNPTGSAATTILNPDASSAQFSSNTTVPNRSTEPSIPVEDPDAEFTVLFELSYTSSTELID